MEEKTELPKLFKYGDKVMNEVEYREWLLTIMPSEMVEHHIAEAKRKFPEYFTK